MNVGTNFQSWIVAQALPVLIGFLAVMAIVYLVKREMGKFVGFLVSALICAIFVVDGKFVVDLFVSFVKKIFG